MWFALSFGLFVAGCYLFGLAFHDYATALPVFLSGILLVSAAFAIPFHLLGRSEQR